MNIRLSHFVSLFVAIAVLPVSLKSLGNIPSTNRHRTAFSQPLFSGQLPREATNIFTGTVTVAEAMNFTYTGNMATERMDHTATLLQNGQVLIIGGFGNDNPASAELYNPAAGTFTYTGSMSIVRRSYTATLLSNGKVLIAGGNDGISSYFASVELYDPNAGTFSGIANMTTARSYHGATRLNDGKVLITGGVSGSGSYLASAELYDPTSNTFFTTGSMTTVRYGHATTLLPNGKVLVVGGQSSPGGALASAELFDPTTGTFSATGSMTTWRSQPNATLLPDGNVLIDGSTFPGPDLPEIYDLTANTFSATGGFVTGRQGYAITSLPSSGKVFVAGGLTRDGAEHVQSVELYDPDTGIFSIAGSMATARLSPTATALPNGTVLITGGSTFTETTASAELGVFMPSNVFTGTLSLPSSWANNSTVSVTFNGIARNAAVNSGALSNNNNNPSEWITATNGVTATTTWSMGNDGLNKPVYLWLRDINGQTARVVGGTVSVDTAPPSSGMTAMANVSPSTFPVSWFASDGLSGVASYDLQVRIGTTGEWIPVLINTTATSTTFTGVGGNTYYFRVRATDIAGNTEPWPATYDVFTLVDADAPTGTLSINGGALNTSTINVTLIPSATDVTSGVAQMHFSSDGGNWSNWQTYSNSASWSLSAGDGIKTAYVQFKDFAGNVSSVASDTITLDTTVETEYGLTINDGAPFTNQVTVTLSISARPNTSQMQVSNDGGFVNAMLEPYASHKTWQITQYGSYVIPRIVYVRYKDINGNTSATFSDDIILDATAPTGSVTIVGAGNKPVRVRNAVTLQLSASDDVSGVGQMRISNQSDFAGSVWQTFATSIPWTLDNNNTVYVRFRDNAGNVSQTYSASGQSLLYYFLPVILK